MKQLLEISSRIRSFAACFVFVILWSSPLPAQNVTITIRLINGRNGDPIKDENLNVFINGSGFAENFRADRNGMIRLTIDRNAVVSFASNIDVTCHPYNRDEHVQRRYPVNEILERGISDQNMCSKKIRVQANPGEFVFYERPRSFWEWMRL